MPAGPSMSPTVRPSPAPTTEASASPTTSDELTVSYTFTVSQTLNGVSYSDYSANLDASNAVVCLTATFVMNIASSDCSVKSVTEARRRLMDLLSSSVVVAYDIEMSELASSSTNSLMNEVNGQVDKLVNATSTGVFNTLLQYYATQNNVPALTNATSDPSVTFAFPLITSPITMSTTSEKLSVGALVGIIIGSVVGFLCIARIVRRRYSKTVNPVAPDEVQNDREAINIEEGDKVETRRVTMTRPVEFVGSLDDFVVPMDDDDEWAYSD